MAKASIPVLFLALALAAPASAQAFTLQRAEVTPAKAFFDGREPIETSFRFADPSPTDVTVQVERRGRVVRRIELKQLAPATDQVAAWDGLDDSGRAAADGKYAIRVGPAGGELGLAGKLVLRGHIYPVRAPHGSRGEVGRFGASRNGGRTHQGFDVVARCGAPLVAARGGTVILDDFNGALDGHFVIIRGRKQNRIYRYSHLPRSSFLDVGDRVRTGDPVGVVGKSGNAAGVGCHLHFEIKQGRRFIDPLPDLRAWDGFS